MDPDPCIDFNVNEELISRHISLRFGNKYSVCDTQRSRGISRCLDLDKRKINFRKL